VDHYTTELEDTGIDEFEVKFIKLLRLCEQLKMENFSLRTQQAELIEQCSDLGDKNEQARQKVASILSRLKEMDVDA